MYDTTGIFLGEQECGPAECHAKHHSCCRGGQHMCGHIPDWCLGLGVKYWVNEKAFITHTHNIHNVTQGTWKSTRQLTAVIRRLNIYQAKHTIKTLFYMTVTNLRIGSRPIRLERNPSCGVALWAQSLQGGHTWQPMTAIHVRVKSCHMPSSMRMYWKGFLDHMFDHRGSESGSDPSWMRS